MLIVDYEGEVVLPVVPPQPSLSPSPIRVLPEVPPDTESPEATDNDGSEDDYVAENVQKKVSTRLFIAPKLLKSFSLLYQAEQSSSSLIRLGRQKRI